MKMWLAIAIGAVLFSAPADARSVHKPHRFKTGEQTSGRAGHRGGLSILSVGSTIKITASGEVVVPPATIAVVHDLPPQTSQKASSTGLRGKLHLQPTSPAPQP